MSEPLRVALVVEGPTDLILLEAAVGCLVRDREVVIQALRPEVSEAFEQLPHTTGGWSGVYRWCKQTADQGDGRVSNNFLFKSHDLLIVHVDADVAEMTYARGHIVEATQDLPCKKPCPPASATTNALRTVVLRWMGERSVPPRAVLCTPSKSLEAWVLAAFIPDHAWVRDGTLECRAHPDKQLSREPKRQRIHKQPEVYRNKAAEFAAAWPQVRATCTEAERFSVEFVQSIP